MALTLDGTVFYHYDLVYYRCQSSFKLTFPQDKVVRGATPDKEVMAVADGYWMAIRADNLGKLDNHVIHFFATADDGYTQDVTYFLEMVDQ
jgi:hypothetical protein